jgi:hypothetical protein
MFIHILISIHLYMYTAEPLSLILAVDQCYKTNQTMPIGTHVITVIQKSTEKQINIGYLMYW